MKYETIKKLLDIETDEQVENVISKLNGGGECRKMIGELLVRDLLEGRLIIDEAGGKS